jgi:lipoprotein-anchoring transpeptidase ErfK/SrfK
VILSSILGLGALAAAGSAEAQVIYNQPPAGSYGGGLVELLMTGRDPTPGVRQRVYPAASPTGGFYQPRAPQGSHIAAVSSAPVGVEETGIGRAADPKYRRQTVEWRGPHQPGTIVIDTPSKFLYLVQPGGAALRYGIGVGRPGFEWSGMKTITMKREWPDWRPPAQMLQRRPDLPRYMAGGPGNPLGATAMYLGSSLYRIHGTNEPHTIGQSVSSGCIRMMNEDVVDLYNRVRVGTHVVVI